MLNPLNYIQKLFKSENQKEIERLSKIVKQINNKENEVKKLSADQFPLKTLQLIEQLSKGEKLEQLIPYAFSLVREAAYRTLNERHFDCQLIGGLGMDGKNL